MKVCIRCGTPREDGSFHTDSRYPGDVCKPCIHRPGSQHSPGLMGIRGRAKREQRAILNIVKQVQKNGQLLVYIARAGRNVKIGYSKNVNQRLQQLSTASPSPIQLIAVVPGDRQLEQELHQEFRKQRKIGEWFRGKGRDIVPRISELPGAMIFLLGYVSQEPPLLGVTE